MDVVSYQPYEADALEDAIRAARDVSGVMTVAVGGVIFAPILPQLEHEALEGAKSHGGVGVRDAWSASATFNLTGQRNKLLAAERFNDDPLLRANADTFVVAGTQEDATSRFITLYRIYEGMAQRLLDQQPRLLSDDEVTRAVDASMSEIAHSQLSDAQHARVRSTLEGNLRRLGKESRPVVLSRAFAELLEREISPDLIKQVDRLRGKSSHNPSEYREFLSDESNAFVFDAVHRLLKLELGIAAE